MPIERNLFNFLIEKVDGMKFENLMQDLLSTIHKDQFVALGGTKDGGADGFFRSSRVLEYKNKQTKFIQISTEKKAEHKIRETVKRLREFGRDVQALFYWTNKKIIVDVIEQKLTNELDIFININDNDRVFRLINTNEETQDVFRRHFKKEIDDIFDIKSKDNKESFDIASDPSIYAFLQFEKTEKTEKGGLIAPILDSLIYWALRETDPETSSFVSRKELKNKLTSLLPAAAGSLISNIDSRLRELSSKDARGNQRIRFYRGNDSESDNFCLPHQMRIELAEQSAKEINLKSDFRTSLINHAIELQSEEPEKISEICEKALYHHFHEQGLILAAFLEKRLDEINVFDQIVEKELQFILKSEPNISRESYAICLNTLKKVLYNPNSTEKDFLDRLSKTTLLLFTIKHNPRLIEYFNKMSGKFRLLIGADMIVKTLSETFLHKEDRHVTNLLEAAKACGSSLILAEPIVNEIFTHLYATHLEFRNYYAAREPYINDKLSSNIDRIMIRTYFYAKQSGKVKSWKSFIEYFVDYDLLDKKSDQGEKQIQAFLQKTYNLDYFSRSKISEGVDQGNVELLADSIEEKKEILKMNDALMCFSVYKQREINKEDHIYDGFGLRTWWLTKETYLLRKTKRIVDENGGNHFIMRPEFLLNFLSNSPKAADIDPVVRDLLPSHVGLQIGQHLDREHMQELLRHVDEWKDLPKARREIRITRAIDRLKFDRTKRYERTLDL